MALKDLVATPEQTAEYLREKERRRIEQARKPLKIKMAEFGHIQEALERFMRDTPKSAHPDIAEIHRRIDDLASIVRWNTKVCRGLVSSMHRSPVSYGITKPDEGPTDA